MSEAAKASLVVSGRTIALGPDGHLLDPADWHEAVAVEMAQRDGLEFDALRWWLIHFVRRHYLDYGMPPLMRIVIQAMRREAVVENPSSRILYRLFPDGPIREVCRYAGLPQPESCI